MMMMHKVRCLFRPRQAPNSRSFASTPSTNAVTTRSKCLLIDGNNMLYHFYDPMCTLEIDGTKNGSIQRLMVLLHRMCKTHRPKHVCVVFDNRKRRTVRKKLDPNYKSDRKPTPTVLRSQFDVVQETLELATINYLTFPGFEADDLIASYTEAFLTAEMDVLVISNDNDMLQLARDSSDESDSQEDRGSLPTVEIYQPNKRKYIRQKNLQGRFGIPPRLLPDFLALCGSGTPHGKIKGIPGMEGEKAVEMLETYGSLHGLLRNLNNVKDDELRKTLKRKITSIEVSYQMCKLNTQISLPKSIQELSLLDFEKFQIQSSM